MNTIMTIGIITNMNTFSKKDMNTKDGWNQSRRNYSPNFTNSNPFLSFKSFKNLIPLYLPNLFFIMNSTGRRKKNQLKLFQLFITTTIINSLHPPFLSSPQSIKVGAHVHKCSLNP